MTQNYRTLKIKVASCHYFFDNGIFSFWGEEMNHKHIIPSINKMNLAKKLSFSVLFVVTISLIFVISIQENFGTKAAVDIADYGNENVFMGDFTGTFYPIPSNPSLIDLSALDEYISLSNFQMIHGSGTSFIAPSAPGAYGKTIRIDTANELYKFSVAANRAYHLGSLSPADKAAYQAEALFYLSASYILGNNIDYFPQATAGNLFMPIGIPELPLAALAPRTATPFIGSFNGNGFEITNLVFGDEDSINFHALFRGLDLSVYDSVYNYFAMFSEVGLGGLIQNVGLINPIIAITSKPDNLNYISALAGRNAGTVEYSYVLDNRNFVEAGYDAWGGFNISGVIGENTATGVINNIFYSGIRVAAQNVGDLFASRPVLMGNYGTVAEAYFNDEVYVQNDVGFIYHSNEQPPLMNGGNYVVVPKTTSELQNRTNILQNERWYTRANAYPKLRGFGYDEESMYNPGSLENPYIIQDEASFLYFVEAVNGLAIYRDKHYRLNSSLDMAKVSPNSFKPITANFTGVLSGEVLGEETIVYSYNHSTLNSTRNHAIINLVINEGSIAGLSFYSAIFARLSGTVKHLNLINGSINIQATSGYTGSDFYVGAVAGTLTGGTIHDVHSNTTINLGSQAIGKLNVGGLVGSGYGKLERVSNTGNITGGVHPFVNAATTSGNVFGGLFGRTTTAGYLDISYALNTGKVEGASFTGTMDFTGALPVVVGGVVGVARTSHVEHIANTGALYTAVEVSPFTNRVHEAYLGGVFGLVETHYGATTTTQLGAYNSGHLYNYYTTGKVRAAGVANVKSSTRLTLHKLSNSGVYYQSTNTGTYRFAGIVYDELSGTNLVRGYNFASFNFVATTNNPNVFPIYYMETLAGIYPTLTEVINYGDITLTGVSSSITSPIYISGITPQNTVNINQARNYGNINVTIGSLATGGVIIGGITREINNNIEVKNATNLGAITYIEASGYNPTYQVKVGGIVGEVLRNVTFENNLPVAGSIYLNNVVNDGYIQVITRTSGITNVGGIVGVNDGFIRDVANLGDVHAMNESTAAVLTIPSGSGFSTNSQPATTHFVYVGGIAGNNRLSTSRIYDSVNYGEIIGYNKYDVSVGGIAGDSPYKESIVRFTINYGDVYAYATTPTMPSENVSCNPNNNGTGTTCVRNGYFMSRARAGGIVGSGRSSYEKVVNRGLVASNDTAGGLTGLMYFTSVTAVEGTSYKEAINYGTVRYISSMSTSFVPGTPTSTFPISRNAYSFVIGNNGQSNVWYIRNTFAAFVGHLYVLPNNLTDNSYPVPKVEFRYLLNTDVIVDAIGRMPVSVSINPNPSGTDWTAIQLSNQTVATTKPSDASQFPLNRWSFPAGTNQTMYFQTKYIKAYSNDDAAPDLPTTNGGIYHESFYMRTGQYPDGLGGYITISNYEEYISYYEHEYLSVSMQNNSVFSTGMYVLANSTGQTNGSFLPANIDLMLLDMVDPYKYCTENTPGYNEGSQYCTIWRDEGSPADPTRINYKFEQMYQLKYSIASSIFNLELLSVAGTRLTAPSIDLYNDTITYTISDNFFNGLAGTSTDFEVYEGSLSLSVRAELFGGMMDNPISLELYSVNLSHTIPESNQYGPFYVNVRSESSLFSNLEFPIINSTVATDYAIYINVTGPSSLVLDGNPLVNGEDATYTNGSNIMDITTPLPTAGGSIEVSYISTNIPIRYPIHPIMNVYYWPDLFEENKVLINSNLYSFYTEIVNNTYGLVYYDSVTSNYKLRYRIEFLEEMPGGNYTIDYNVYGVNYRVKFTKTASQLREIVDINYEEMGDLSIDTINKTISSSILFGTLLDYWNVTPLTNGLPSYLSYIEISPNATVTDYMFVSITTSGYYKSYQMQIEVTSESNHTTNWIHTITERTVNTNLASAFQNGQTIPTSMINFDREAGYTEIEAEYNDDYLHNRSGHIELYSIKQDNILLTFNEFGQVYDLSSQLLIFAGVDTDNFEESFVFAYLYEPTLPGDYEFIYRYQDEYEFPSQVLVDGILEDFLVWDMPFEALLITKNKGKNTYLQNITFTSVGMLPRYPDIRSKAQFEDPLQPITISIYANRIYYNAITTTGEFRDKEFYVEGYVRGSDLAAYAPTFPEYAYMGGARVERCSTEFCDQLSDPTTTDLYANFNMVDDEITWVKYRVVSEDEQFITIYNISVIDVEYNIAFKFNIYNVTKNIDYTYTILPSAYASLSGEIFTVTFRNIQTNRMENNFNSGAFTQVIGVVNQMTSAAWVGPGIPPNDYKFYTRQFETNTSGDYLIRLHVPDGYQYTIFKGNTELLSFANLAETVENKDDYDGYYYYVIPTVRGSYHELNFYVYQEEPNTPWGFRSIWKFWEKIFN